MGTIARPQRPGRKPVGFLVQGELLLLVYSRSLDESICWCITVGVPRAAAQMVRVRNGVNNFGEISENFPFPLVTGIQNFGIFRKISFSDRKSVV